MKNMAWTAAAGIDRRARSSAGAAWAPGGCWDVGIVGAGVRVRRFDVKRCLRREGIGG